MRRINIGGRIIVCGGISNYNAGSKQRDIQHPPTNYMALIPLRGTMKGFIVFDYKDRYHTARQNLIKWIQNGLIKLTNEDIKVDGGLSKAPYYLQQMFHGNNIGKLIVQVSKPTNIDTTVLESTTSGKQQQQKRQHLVAKL